MQRARRLLGASAVILSALLARRTTVAQMRLGAEFRVNSFTTYRQDRPDIASDSAGDFVVIWESQLQDGSSYPSTGVFGQRYASSGALLGAEFRVNSYTTNSQRSPVVASDSLGNFVVVWTSYQYGTTTDIFGQRYSSSGAPLGTEFRVSSYTTNGFDAAVGSDPAGNFVVVWMSLRPGSNLDVFGQRYSSSGAPVGTEFRVNSYTTSDQSHPTIAFDSTGDFVVVWDSLDLGGSSSRVIGQRYLSSGAPLGTEFQVNSYTTGALRVPKIASDPAGDFVVVWMGNDPSSNFGVIGQRYAMSGAPLGVEFRVNSYTSGGQSTPAVASDSAGNFVVVWGNFAQDGSGDGVFGQRYAGTGEPLGAEFQVNTYTTFGQSAEAISSDPSGNIVVVWDSNSQDGSLDGIFAQRLCSPLSAVSVSTTGTLSVCPTSTGGKATVTDTGGGTNAHQWVYSTTAMGASTPIAGQTGATYVISGADFGVPPGTPGLYYLYCLTTPSCGSQMFSTETIIVTVSTDATPPAVTPPPSLTTSQTLCQ